ncbi:MAG TPA: RecQ family ATP-dependent DNA helicase [Myxococcaceae bacterium]|nr:RecQ family ATP-dependent DNA helicase [Myxococcaceae bacterium]
MTDTHAHALELLKRLTGRDDAVFHEGQFEAIETLVDRRLRALVVQRTGWGKSAVYFLSTLLLRARGAGPTLLVSPLLALMRDQVSAAERAGVRAAAINSTNPTEWEDIRAALKADALDVLLVSPERLNNPGFREEQLPELVRRAGLLVVDEAHCISDWGHDFRPDYRRLRELVARMPEGVPVLATTATANARVVADIAEQLSPRGVPNDVVTLRGPLARASLRLGVLELPDDRTRLAWLLTHLTSLPGSGIIYALTVSAAEDTARILREAGHQVLAYTGRTDTAEREEAERRLKANEVKALVATSALGMGFDKPDLGFVVHLGAPSSPVAYYQQVGRAGRATASADVLLLPGSGDRAVWDYFATASMPDPEKAEAVLRELATSDAPLSSGALEARVNLRRSPLELLLKVLDVDGAVRRVKGGWVATGQPWTYDVERYDRISKARVDEQASMLTYQRTEGCRMAFLQTALDDSSAAPCGRCDRCAGPWFPSDVESSAGHRAQRALAKVGVAIEPRIQWPTGADRLGVEVKGRIAAEERVAEGRALARFTDLGWGNALRSLYVADAPDSPVGPEVLKACFEVLRDWDWAERPEAVISVPSRRFPQRTASVAQGLATAGKLPYLGALSLRHGGPTGESGGNSAFRLAGVWDRFEIDPELGVRLNDFRGRPVLLVDDRVDSRWTLTVTGRLLRRAGVGEVLPFALALQA